MLLKFMTLSESLIPSPERGRRTGFRHKQKMMQLKIFHKFLLLSGILIGFLFILGIVFYTNMSHQREVLNNIVNFKFKNISETSSLSIKILTLHNDIGRIVRWSALGYLSGEEAGEAVDLKIKQLHEIEQKILPGLLHREKKEEKEVIDAFSEYKEWLVLVNAFSD